MRGGQRGGERDGVLAEQAARLGQRDPLAVDGRERQAGGRLEPPQGREGPLGAGGRGGAEQRAERREVGERDGGQRS